MRSPGVAQRRHTCIAVDVRQPEVEHDRIRDIAVWPAAAPPARSRREQHLVAAEQQRAPDRRPHRIVVLDHQNSHTA